MPGSTPRRCCPVLSFLLLFSIALVFTPRTVSAQQNGVHVWHPIAATPVHPAPAPIVSPMRQVTGPRTTTIIRRPYPSPGVRPIRIAPGVILPGRTVSPRVSNRLLAATPIFFQPYFFGGSFPVRYFASSPASGRLPLGFGLWPACDSAGTPGVFWTVGPCFGIGDYSGELSAAPSEYPFGGASPTAYLLPLFFPEQAAAAPSQPSTSAPPSPMILYQTDGATISASDWWVANGRLQYITTSGATGSMELSKFDMEQTIKQNEARGHDFFLKFTPPSNLYPPSERP